MMEDLGIVLHKNEGKRDWINKITAVPVKVFLCTMNTCETTWTKMGYYDY